MVHTLSLVIVIGNLGAVPEIRTGPDGRRISVFQLATDGHRTDPATGHRVSRTQWHRVSCHNDFLTEMLERRARKGQLIFVRGRHETRSGSGSRSTQIDIVVDASDGDVRILTEA